MWIRYLIFTALLLSSVNCGRNKPTVHEEFVKKEIVKETLDKLQVELNKLNENQLQKYNFDAKKLSLLLNALEDLGEESVKLVILLIDGNSSTCLAQIGKVGVIEAECTVSEEDIKFFISYRGSLNNVVELTKLIESLQFVEDNLITFKTQLLSHRQDNFHKYIATIETQKNSTELVLEGAKKYFTSTGLKLYADDIKETLNSLEIKINDLARASAQQQQSVEHGKEIITDSISGVKHSSANATAQFVCDVEINGDKKAVKYLDLDDVADLRKLLDNMLDEFIQRINSSPSGAIDPEVNKELDEILERIQNNTKFLENLVDANHIQQKNLLNAFEEALKSNNVGTQEKLLKQISNLEDAAKAIIEIYQEKKSLDEALAACDRFDNFEALVAGLLALNNTQDVRLPKSFENLVYDKMLERLKMHFTGDVFCCHSASIVYSIYKVHPKTAINILIRLQKGLDASDFYVGEHNWLNHVIIFLFNNLKISLKNSCKPDLFQPINSRNYQKYFRRVLAYIQILRLLEPNDLELFEMTGNLQHLIYSYWKDVSHLKTLEICKEYKN